MISRPHTEKDATHVTEGDGIVIGMGAKNM